jgi:uncharacterized protein
MERMSEKPSELGAVPRWLDLRPLGLIALAGALVWSTAITAGTWKSVRVKPEQRTIKVTGSAKKRIVSDLIDWQTTIEARAPDRTAAYKRLREDGDKAVAFLEGQGIKKAEIQPQSATFEEEFDVREEFKVVPGIKDPVRIEKKVSKGFVTRETITVRSTDVPRVERASREITSLLEQGVSITSGDPSYFYTRLGELKVEMLAAAGKDARARADNILKSAGGAAISKLRVADMGIININPANSTETSEEGNNDKTSFEKDIITIVHAEFELGDE